MSGTGGSCLTSPSVVALPPGKRHEQAQHLRVEPHQRDHQGEGPVPAQSRVLGIAGLRPQHIAQNFGVTAVKAVVKEAEVGKMLG